MKTICDFCEGVGEVKVSENLINKHNSHKQTHYMVCNKCNGSGRLDWIDELIPNEEKYIYRIKIESI